MDGPGALRRAVLVMLVLGSPAFADDPAAPDAVSPDAAKLRELEQRLAALEHPTPPVQPAAPPQPLDVREPTFGEFDFGWMNGNNSQPASLVQTGPLTLSLYVDTYYGYQFHRPIDHTVFPTTTAPRHDEISLNLAHLGVDVTGLDGPIGRLYLQYGSTVETIAGQDTTTTRGYYLTNRLLQNVEQAAVGWHFHRLHGINTEVGIFPSYVGLESYLPEENWAYNHAFLSDWTPFYFFGVRGQLLLTRRMKLELWVVNGWQTFGEWHEARAGGYLWNWRPREWLSLVHSLYAGREAQGDPDSLRLYTDNNVQLRYYHDPSNHALVRSLALSLVTDLGHEHRGDAPSGWMGGVSLANHVEWNEHWKCGLRVDFAADETQAINTKLPVGSPYTLPGKGRIIAGGVTATLDYWPSPWLVTRLEYAHREANQPYFSGRGGITGPGGVPAPDPATFTPDLVHSDDRVTLDVTLRL
ncbi:MAG: outer membrane beta-barrel protein [Kofleriaceae bacterium]